MSRRSRADSRTRRVDRRGGSARAVRGGRRPRRLRRLASHGCVSRERRHVATRAGARVAYLIRSSPLNARRRRHDHVHCARIPHIRIATSSSARTSSRAVNLEMAVSDAMVTFARPRRPERAARPGRRESLPRGRSRRRGPLGARRVRGAPAPAAGIRGACSATRADAPGRAERRRPSRAAHCRLCQRRRFGRASAVTRRLRAAAAEPRASSRSPAATVSRANCGPVPALPEIAI